MICWQRWFATGVVLYVTSLGVAVCADDAAPEPAPISQWIRQLGADDFAQRREAREHLAAQGGAAIDPLRDAALEAEGPLAAECVQLLRRLSVNDDAAVQAQAEAALKALAESDNEEVAQLAQGTILPAAPEPGQQGVGNVGGIQIQVNGRAWRPGAGQFFQNGKREAEVEENGKKIKITEMRGGPITVTTTETVNGQEVVTEVQAGNAAELHQKDQAAFDLYRKHLLMPQAQFVPGPVLVPQPFGGLPPFGVPPVPMQLGGGNFRFENVSITNVNGQRAIDVSSNDLSLHIEDTGGTDIRMDITETKDGETTTRSLDATDVDDLRAQDEAAAELYEKYAKGNRARAGGFGFGGGADQPPP